MCVLVLRAPGPIPGPIRAQPPPDTGLALTINALNEPDKGAGRFLLRETIPRVTLQGFLLCRNKAAFNEI